MIHKAFFVCGIVLLIIAAVMHHRHDYVLMHCFHRHWSHKKVSDIMLSRFSKKLNLNEVQQSKLEAIRDDLIVKRDSMRSEHQEQYQILIHELEKDTLDKEHLNAMFREKMNQVQEIHPVVLNQLAEFHAILSAEQKHRLIEMVRKHHQRMS